MGTNTTSFYLDPPQLIGRPNSDGTVTLTPLELKKLNDYNYAVSKMLQGNLNLANLNAETNEVFTGMVTFTDLSTGGSTVINGSNITTGTINANLITTGTLSANRVTGGILQGVEIISEGTSTATVNEGTLSIWSDNPETNPYATRYADIGYYSGEGKVFIESNGVPLKIVSNSNLSIDSGGTIYIGVSSGYSGDVTIGDGTGTINLNAATVNKNGVPL